LFATVCIGCFHATIETGATPSTLTIEKSFAASWIDGLVPPSTVETAEKCPNGVAIVETQRTFVNGLVAFLTWGIYTPMWIKVTCAERGHADSGPAATNVSVSLADGTDAVRAAFESAGDAAVAENKRIIVQVRR
jgi:hypothetical protein